MPFLINFENMFILIFLNILNIEVEEDSDINELENFNIGIQIHLASKEEYEEFTIIRINFNIIRENDKEYPYNEDDFYFEFNNIGYNRIIQMNCIYNYYILHLRFKVTNNFFFKTMFRFIKKVY